MPWSAKSLHLAPDFGGSGEVVALDYERRKKAPCKMFI